MSTPAWFPNWGHRFTYQADGDTVRLICRRCGDVLGFTHSATDQTIRAEMVRHVYGRQSPPLPPDCGGDT